MPDTLDSPPTGISSLVNRILVNPFAIPSYVTISPTYVKWCDGGHVL